MRLSNLPVTTLKEVPADAEVISHRLMLRAGLIRKLASGLFTWMPLGLKVLHKVEQLVRSEMDRAGALEILMPAIQPAELWEETGRWNKYGSLLLRINDRHGRNFCFGPTHEEVVTDVARKDLRSYKQLPVTYYQIQTKFRDEIRPRFGLMRAREFIMKDAYSFHTDTESLEQTYDSMAKAYTNILSRIGLEFRPVDAAAGEIGGSKSCEFHVLADSGEDGIAYCDNDNFAMNVELAPTFPPEGARAAATETMTIVSTPGMRTIDDITEFLKIHPSRCLKTLLVEADDDSLIALIVRGDHELNALKAEQIDGVKTPLTMANSEQILAATGTGPGFVGPVGLDLPIWVDHSAAFVSDFICGGNASDEHCAGVNWGRDLPEPTTADLRNVQAGDRSPGGGTIAIARGIEVGHIFQLGDQYSKSMNLNVLDQNGKALTPLMGCYGIGISRLVAAAIEQNNDDNGIIWPTAISPFPVTILGLNYTRSQVVKEAVDNLAEALSKSGIEALIDDRDARPGVKFADSDLMGIPHRLVVGERGLKEGKIEYRHRRASETEEVELTNALAFIQAKLETH
ncbi:MAG: proline--tRNA ligase [Gammaproteobacteria bacterium]|nr:proline--tRNA ligase [Gammaproteobacteria bacterium]